MTDARAQTRAWLAASPLADPEQAPLRPSEEVTGWGPTLVVAPHPDDESLGCGGALALLAERNLPVRVLVVSDGTLSHPHSVKFPAPRLRDLREGELQDALQALGLPPDHDEFMRFPDRGVPGVDAPGFDDAVRLFQKRLTDWPPQTVLLPWRRDPHPDHRAVFESVSAACRCLHPRPRLIEYPIWIWDLAAQGDLPEPGETNVWRLDIGAVAARKQAAIRCHRSQTTDLIDDDPQCFRLWPDTLAHFDRPWELYLETAP